MSSSKITRIYVDTNVLINYCTDQDADVRALRYIFSKRRKEALFTSIKAGFSHLNNDVEDSVHYVLSQKMKCDAILTNNTADFTYFRDITLLDTGLALLKPKIQ